MISVVIMRMDTSGEMPAFQATERVFIKPRATEEEIAQAHRSADFEEYPTLPEATERAGEPANGEG